MGSRKWLGLVASLVLISACYGAMTPKAENNKGDIYYYGQGVPKNYQKADYWFRKAAVQGYAPAENNMGLAYYTGQGVPKNYQKGAYWFRKAVRQGNAKAEFNIGVAYYHGHGVPQNYQKGVYWLRKAAVQGYANAELGMGVAYLLGHAVPANYVQAYKWCALARSAAQPGTTDYKHASALLNRLTPRMSAAQITQAQSLAYKWAKAHEK